MIDLIGVNALNGLFLFLLERLNEGFGDENVCQRPKRAFLISTAKKVKRLIDNTVCQRPKRAFLISTNLTQQDIQAKVRGVNALNGLFLFLRVIAKMWYAKN